MLNKVSLIGRVGQTPETRSLNNGSQVCKFTLATTEKYTDKSGQKQETTEWHNCTAFGKLSEIISQYVKKGDLLYVEGLIKTNSWEKDGQKHYKTEINVREMKMLGGKKYSSQQGSVGGFEGQKSEPCGFGSQPTGIEDDIPF